MRSGLACLVLFCRGGFALGGPRFIGHSLPPFGGVSRPAGARSFLLLAQEKRTKEKGTPVRRSPGCARRVRSALRGFSDGPSMARRKMADILSATLRALSSALHRLPRGSGRQARNRQATRATCPQAREFLQRRKNFAGS